MPVHKRLLTFALVAGMMAGSSKAIAGKPGSIDRGKRRGETRHSRRHASRPPTRQNAGVVPSPDGRYTVQVENGHVRLNGRPVREEENPVWLLAAPVWRQDGNAVAWIERVHGTIRLVVIPDVSTPKDALTWALPATTSDDGVSWAGTQRVHVGALPLAPKAVATWTEGV